MDEQQAQRKMIIDIVKQAGLDANNIEHQKAAVEVLRNIGELQTPEREKEYKGLMREFGLQPDEIDKTTKGFEQQSVQLKSQEELLETRRETIGKKYVKSDAIKLAGAFAIGAAVAVASYMKPFSNFTKMKKLLSTAAALVGGTVLGKIVTSFIPSKALDKQTEDLKLDVEKLGKQEQQFILEAKEYELGTITKLASNMLKARVETKDEPAKETPEVNTPELVADSSLETPPLAQEEAKELPEKSFTQKVEGAKTPAEKVLEKTTSAISPEAIAEQKMEAEAATPQVG